MTFRFHARQEPTKMFAWVTYMDRHCVDGSTEAFKLQPQIVGRHGDAPWFTEPMDDGQFHQFMQAIVNEAARHGIYPSEGASTIRVLTAHLEDMRALAFGRAKPENQ